MFVKIRQDQSASFEETEGRGRSYIRMPETNAKLEEMGSHMDLLHQKVFIHLLCHVYSYKVSTTTYKPEGQRGYCHIDRSLWYFLWGIWRHSPCRHSSVLKKYSVFLTDQLDALSSFFDPTHVSSSHPPLEMLYYRSHVTVRWCLALRNPCRPIRFKCWIINWPTFGSSSAPE